MSSQVLCSSRFEHALVLVHLSDVGNQPSTAGLEDTHGLLKHHLAPVDR
jgi:hypothetical protein